MGTPVVKYPNFDQKWAPNIGIMQNTQTHISRHMNICVIYPGKWYLKVFFPKKIQGSCRLPLWIQGSHNISHWSLHQIKSIYHCAHNSACNISPQELHWRIIYQTQVSICLHPYPYHELGTDLSIIIRGLSSRSVQYLSRSVTIGEN